MLAFVLFFNDLNLCAASLFRTHTFWRFSQGFFGESALGVALAGITGQTRTSRLHDNISGLLASNLQRRIIPLKRIEQRRERVARLWFRPFLARLTEYPPDQQNATDGRCDQADKRVLSE